MPRHLRATALQAKTLRKWFNVVAAIRGKTELAVLPGMRTLEEQPLLNFRIRERAKIG